MWVAIGASGNNAAASVFERGTIPGVVPYVPGMTPVQIGPGVTTLARMDLDVAVSLQPVGPESVDMTLFVAKSPVSQRDSLTGPVMQLNPLVIETRV